MTSSILTPPEGGRDPSGQALAVPATPASAVDGPSGFDPSRSMVPYGPDHPDYPNAPSDWDGGPYLCRDGKLYHMRGYGWAHGLGCWNPTASWDRIAYRTAIATEARRAETTGSVHEGAGPKDIAQGPSQ